MHCKRCCGLLGFCQIAAGDETKQSVALLVWAGTEYTTWTTSLGRVYLWQSGLRFGIVHEFGNPKLTFLVKNVPS